MNMINRFTKFYEGIASGQGLNFITASAIELSEKVNFVYSFVQKPYTSEQF